jgi:hypothetical protein
MEKARPFVSKQVVPLERARHAGELLNELGSAARQMATYVGWP